MFLQNEIHKIKFPLFLPYKEIWGYSLVGFIPSKETKQESFSLFFPTNFSLTCLPPTSLPCTLIMSSFFICFK